MFCLRPHSYRQSISVASDAKELENIRRNIAVISLILFPSHAIVVMFKHWKIQSCWPCMRGRFTLARVRLGVFARILTVFFHFQCVLSI